MRHPIRRIAALSLGLCAAAAASAASDSALYAANGSPLYAMPTYESVAPGSPIHSGGATPADTSLALDVAAALASNPKLDGSTITVSAVNGEVSLSGSAPSTEQGAHAESTAKRVAGVRSVTGTLSALGG